MQTLPHSSGTITIEIATFSQTDWRLRAHE